MSTKARLIPENFDRKKGLNNIQLKNLNQKPKFESRIPLDSGVVAKLPTFEEPIERKGPFDIGLPETWTIYIILSILVIVALIGFILTILGLTIDIFSVAYTKNQEIKLFGVVLTSTVLTSSTILLFCFCCQHAKEVGFLPNAHYTNDFIDSEPLGEAAKISALYSIDPKLQNEESKPVSPSQVQPTHISKPPVIIY
ncbi:hypothetical protein BpHYR1_002917 [Brachionus plicatilis]|uniref:Uncharacterized protein n=1 Tax=Brachionus plicatilis TaxID=10195 RepID=A0A3M7P3P1_BRAPC|nr:hypothetical protein BpHYR1_002917 [Brachionus plicatilis]